ncbi:hypothetical protein [Psychromonas ossibalaenae]|uniref:hypothetical protein n=1 Tax=Psychromonas ossibalaenae TaxID=444922 RepID=UPI00035D7CE9|nr:hypothetical protein [Psychromonas ossibalaenae]
MLTLILVLIFTLLLFSTIIYIIIKILSNTSNRGFISGIYKLEALPKPVALTLQQVEAGRPANWSFSVKTVPGNKEVFSSLFRSRANKFIKNKMSALNFEYHIDPSLQYPSLNHNFSSSSDEYLLQGTGPIALLVVLVIASIYTGNSIYYFIATSIFICCFIGFFNYFALNRSLRKFHK